MTQKKQGILYIITAAFFFALMSFFIRESGDLPTMQKSFFRNAVAVVVSFIMLIRSEGKFKIKQGSFPYLFMRALFGTGSLICNFYAIDKMNISDANMLNKLAPFFAIIMSVKILDERANKIEWMTVVIAFIGAIFVVKPSLSMACAPALAAAFGGFGAGTAYTFVRKLGKHGERGPVIVMFFSAFSCIISLPFLIFDYHPMTLMQFTYLMCAGCAATMGQLTVTAAYTKAAAKDISVFDYAQVIFAAILGMLFLGQIPDVYSLIGYVIIIGAAVFKWHYNKEKENSVHKNVNTI